MEVAGAREPALVARRLPAAHSQLVAHPRPAAALQPAEPRIWAELQQPVARQPRAAQELVEALSQAVVLSTERPQKSTATGDFAVFTCPMAQSECKAEMVGEPSLFECVDSHVPNCRAKLRLGGTSWVFVGLCADLGTGGAGGAK